MRILFRVGGPRCAMSEQNSDMMTQPPTLKGQMGLAHREQLLARKSLYPAERQAAPATVCVTGGAGYVGSRIVARLLAAGHTVHSTHFAAENDQAAVAALDELPGAQQRLRWFQADLIEAGSVDAAVEGCSVVIHSAGVLTTGASPQRGGQDVIQSTLRALQNVLSAVTQASTVEKVIFTSSLLAALSEDDVHRPGHAVTEADWNLSFPKRGEPYVMAKVLAEWQAWAIAAQQDRWKLIAICPGHVYGPPLGTRTDHGPLPSVVRLMNGSLYPFVAPLGLTTVDVDDVAAAHTLAAVLPHARGRYLLCERSTLLSDVAALLRRTYPDYWVPHFTPPFWAAAPLLALAGGQSLQSLRSGWGKQPAAVDCSKAWRELGLEFIPLEQTLKDEVDRLMDVGLLKRNPVYSTAPASLPLPTGAAGSEFRTAAKMAASKVAEVAQEAEEKVEAAVRRAVGKEE